MLAVQACDKVDLFGFELCAANDLAARPICGQPDKYYCKYEAVVPLMAECLQKHGWGQCQLFAGAKERESGCVEFSHQFEMEHKAIAQMASCGMLQIMPSGGVPE